MTRRVLAAAAAIAALAVVPFAVAGALYEPNTEIPAGFAGSHVDVNGVALRVLQEGRGRDVLLIHGSPGSLEDWTPIFDRLSGSFRLTSYDRPGHGFSADAGEYSAAANATWALGLIDALGLDDVVVIGHSYGGATALAMAVRAPPAVAAYVIVDSAAYTPSREVGVLNRALAAPWVGTGIARVLGPERAAPRIERGIAQLFRGRPPDGGFVALRTRLWSSPKVTHALSAEIVGAREGLRRLSPKYPEIRDPTFIVAQADDEFRRTTAERLHRDVAGSVLTLVPGTGHYIQFEQPAAVADAIRAAASATSASAEGPAPALQRGAH